MGRVGTLGSEVRRGVLGFEEVGLPTSSSVSPVGSASVEAGLEKAMGCCFGDGIPIHGCVVGLSSEGLGLSPEAALFVGEFSLGAPCELWGFLCFGMRLVPFLGAHLRNYLRPFTDF
jgi:hypothetical protein